MATRMILASFFLLCSSAAAAADSRSCLGEACSNKQNWAEGDEDQSLTMIQRRSAAIADASERPKRSSYINADSPVSQDGRHVSSHIDRTNPETGHRFKLKYDGVLADGYNLVNLDEIEDVVKVSCDEAKGTMQIEVGTSEHAQSLMDKLAGANSTGAGPVVTGHALWGCANEHGESKSIMHHVTKAEAGVTSNVIALQTSRAKLEELFENLNVSMVAPARQKRANPSLALRQSSEELSEELVQTDTTRWGRRRRRRSSPRRRVWGWAQREAAQRAADLAAARARAEAAAEQAKEEAEARAEAAKEAAEKRAEEAKEEAEEKAEEEKEAAEARAAALKKKAEEKAAAEKAAAEARAAALKKKAEAAKAAALARAQAAKEAAQEREEKLKAAAQARAAALKQKAEDKKEEAEAKAKAEEERAEEIKAAAEAKAKDTVMEAKDDAVQRAQAIKQQAIAKANKVKARAQAAKQKAVARVQQAKADAEAEKNAMVKKANAYKTEAEADAEAEKQKAVNAAEAEKAKAEATAQAEKKKAEAMKEQIILKAQTEELAAEKKAEAEKQKAEDEKEKAEEKCQAEIAKYQGMAEAEKNKLIAEAQAEKAAAIKAANAEKAKAEADVAKAKLKAETAKNNAEAQAKAKVVEEKNKAEKMKQEAITKADAEKEKAIDKADEEKEKAISKADEEKEKAYAARDEAEEKADEEEEKAEQMKQDAINECEEEKKKAENMAAGAKAAAIAKAEEEKQKAIAKADSYKAEAEKEKEKALNKANAMKAKAEADAQAAEAKAEADAKAAATKAIDDTVAACKAADDAVKGVVSAAEGKINTNKMIPVPGMNSFKWNVDSKYAVKEKKISFSHTDPTIYCEDCYYYVDAYVHLDINVQKFKLNIMECVLMGSAKANLGIRQPVKAGQVEYERILDTIHLATIDFMIGIVPFHLSMSLVPTMGLDGEIIGLPAGETTDTFGITAYATGSIQQGIKVDNSGTAHINVVDYDYGYNTEGLPPGSSIVTAAYVKPEIQIKADLIGGPMLLTEKFQINGNIYAPGDTQSETCSGNAAYFTSDFTRETMLSSSIDIKLGKYTVYQKDWPTVVLDQQVKPLISGCFPTSLNKSGTAALSAPDRFAKETAEAEADAEAAAKKAAAVKAAAEAAAKKAEEEKAAAEKVAEEALIYAPSWAWKLNAAGDLMGILKGPVSGSGKTEVHTLSLSSNYQSYNLQVATAQAYTFGGSEEWDFGVKSNGDLVGIFKGPVTGSGKTEVHIMTAASNYRTYSLHAATAQGYTASVLGDEWDFLVKANGDLVGVLKGPNTGSGKTEVHIMTAASNYQQYSLHAATAQGYTASSLGAEWDFALKPNGDLVGILKGPVTGSGKTEVHIMTAASNYNTYSLHMATSMGYTASSLGDEWAFDVRPNGNLVGILKGPNTGSRKTEVHALSADSNYKTFTLQVGTAQAYTNTPAQTLSLLEVKQVKLPIGTGTTFSAQLVPTAACPLYPVTEFSCTVHSELDPHSAAAQSAIELGLTDVDFGCSIHRKWEKAVKLPDGITEVPALSSKKVHPTEFKQMKYVYDDGAFKPAAGATKCGEYKEMDEDEDFNDPCFIHMYTSTGNLPKAIPDMSFTATLDGSGLVLSEVVGHPCYELPITMERGSLSLSAM